MDAKVDARRITPALTNVSRDCLPVAPTSLHAGRYTLTAISRNLFSTPIVSIVYSEAIGVERDARLDAYIELEDEGRGLLLADHSRLCSAGDHQRQGTPRTTIITRVFVADSSYNFWCEGKSRYAAVSRPCSALCESVQESSAASDGGDTDAGVAAFTVLKHSNGGERATQ